MCPAWISAGYSSPSITERSKPEELVVFERLEWGNFFGFLESVSAERRTGGRGRCRLAGAAGPSERVDEIRDQIRHLEKPEIGAINYAIERLRLERRKLELEGRDTPEALADIDQQRDSTAGGVCRVCRKGWTPGMPRYRTRQGGDDGDGWPHS